MLAQPVRPPLAFSTLAFPSASLARAAEVGAAAGYRGIELRLVDGELIDPAMPPAERLRVRRLVEREHLAVVAVDSSIRLLEPGSEEQLRGFLELANAWEAPIVRVFGGSLPSAPSERAEALARAARLLERLAPLAEGLGVRVGVETHDVFSASAVLAELLALVEASAVGALWDSHHPHRVGERPGEVVANLGERVLHTHLKDARRSAAKEGGWQLVLLGEGEVPVREMLSLLLARGYQGYLSVEWEKAWHPEIEDPEIALPQHLRLLERWLAELEAEGRESGDPKAPAE